jgi:hypothetical protein
MQIFSQIHLKGISCTYIKADILSCKSHRQDFFLNALQYPFTNVGGIKQILLFHRVQAQKGISP